MARFRSGIAIGTALLAACGSGEFADLQGFVRDSHSELRGRVDQVPQVAAAEPFAYDVTDLPDPFAAQRIVPRNADPGCRPPDGRARTSRLPPIRSNPSPWSVP